VPVRVRDRPVTGARSGARSGDGVEPPGTARSAQGPAPPAVASSTASVTDEAAADPVPATSPAAPDAVSAALLAAPATLLAGEDVRSELTAVVVSSSTLPVTGTSLPPAFSLT